MLLPVLVFVNVLGNTPFLIRALAPLCILTCPVEYYLSPMGETHLSKDTDFQRLGADMGLTNVEGDRLWRLASRAQTPAGCCRNWQWRSFGKNHCPLFPAALLAWASVASLFPRPQIQVFRIKHFSVQSIAQAVGSTCFHFMKSFFVFEKGNREWWEDGLRKEWEDFRELSWFLHCALYRFLILHRGSPTTLPGGSCYASIRDGETKAQRDKATCTLS